jgi:methylenetetrahydrofolate reductase (NADH)
MSRLEQALESGRFVVTGEIGPPKGASLDRCLNDAEMLRGHVTAINVTDLRSAVMRVGSLAVSVRLVERGLEPVYQLTCRDRNRLALQSDLLSTIMPAGSPTSSSGPRPSRSHAQRLRVWRLLNDA